MKISGKSGVSFKSEGDLFIDSTGIRNHSAIITHGHSDHAKTSSTNTYYMTPGTLALIPEAKRKGAIECVPFGKKFAVGDFTCSLEPSGHILGSSQVKVSNSIDAVVTSDFKLQKSILFDSAEIIPSDVLVIETTFGKQGYSFPEREKVYEEMIAWMHSCLSKGAFIVLGGYSTGKAQELTKIVNEFLNETPLVHPRVYEQNLAYESQGIKLGGFIKLDHNLNDSDILIMPPHLINDDLLHALSHQLKRKVECAIATGWKRHSKYRAFPLSDHADFGSLVRYVRESNPKLVLTMHGFEREFASYVNRRLKIPAKPLSQARQMMLQEFA